MTKPQTLTACTPQQVTDLMRRGASPTEIAVQVLGATCPICSYDASPHALKITPSDRPKSLGYYAYAQKRLMEILDGSSKYSLICSNCLEIRSKVAKGSSMAPPAYLASKVFVAYEPNIEPQEALDEHRQYMNKRLTQGIPCFIIPQDLRVYEYQTKRKFADNWADFASANNLSTPVEWLPLNTIETLVPAS